MPDESGTVVPSDALPFTIRCRGRRRDGRSCRSVLAVVEHGIVLVRDGGRVHVDPASTSCPKCGTVRSFRGGVREEILAARGATSEAA